MASSNNPIVDVVRRFRAGNGIAATSSIHDIVISPAQELQAVETGMLVPTRKDCSSSRYRGVHIYLGCTHTCDVTVDPDHEGLPVLYDSRGETLVL